MLTMNFMKMYIYFEHVFVMFVLRSTPDHATRILIEEFDLKPSNHVRYVYFKSKVGRPPTLDL